MAHPIVLGGKTEIEADGLGVPNMRIAIWLWRKAGDDTATIFVTSPIFCDDIADKVRGGRRIGCRHKYSSCLACPAGALPPMSASYWFFAYQGVYHSQTAKGDRGHHMQ